MKKIFRLFVIVTVFLLVACSGNDTLPTVEDDASTSDQDSLNTSSDPFGSDEHSDLDASSNLRSLVTFAVDHEAFLDTIDWSVVDWGVPESMPQDPALTIALIREISNLPYVEASEYSMPTWAESQTLYRYTPGIGADRWDEREFFQLRGTSEADLFPMTATIIELIAGRTFTSEEMNSYTEINPAIVSKEFAGVNDLSVGSTFTLDVTIRIPYLGDDEFNWEWESSEESIYTERSFAFEIVGTFETLESARLDFLDDSWSWTIEDGIHSSISSSIHVPNVVIEEMIMYRYQTERNMIVELELEDHDWFRPHLEPHPRVESLMILSSSHEFENFERAALDILPEFLTVEDISTLMTKRD